MPCIVKNHPVESDAQDKASVSFGLTLREKREDFGLSQEGLSDLSGISRTHISEIERGIASPTLEALSRIANGLGIPVSQLVLDWEKRAL